MFQDARSSGAKARRVRLRLCISALLIMAVAFGTLPAAVAASFAYEATLLSASLVDDLTSIASGWLTKIKKAPKKTKGGTQQDLPIATGTKPHPPRQNRNVKRVWPQFALVPRMK